MLSLSKTSTHYIHLLDGTRRAGLHSAISNDGSAISDTAEFPPTSHTHIHQYQNHQRSAPEATARRDPLAVHARPCMSTVSLRRGLAFSWVSLLYNNLRMCFSRNTAKNKSQVICVLCCELVVVLSDGTISSASRRCFMTSRVVKSTVQRGPVSFVYSAATLQFCSFCVCVASSATVDHKVGLRTAHRGCRREFRSVRDCRAHRSRSQNADSVGPARRVPSSR